VGDALDAVTGVSELTVAPAVGREGDGVAVPRVAVGLEDEAGRRPEEVDAVLEDRLLRLR
jgi:hypothetical protein